MSSEIGPATSASDRPGLTAPRDASSRTRRIWGVQRLVLVLVGNFLMILASMAVGGYGSLGLLVVGDRDVFEDPPVPDEVEALPLIDSGARRVVVTLGISETIVRSSIELPSDDPLVRSVGEGSFLENPGYLADFVASVWLVDAYGGTAWIEWGPPTVASTSSGTSTITVAGTSGGLASDLAVVIQGCPQCGVDFEVSTDGGTVVSAKPQDYVTSQTNAVVNGSFPAGPPSSEDWADLVEAPRVTIGVQAGAGVSEQNRGLLSGYFTGWLKLMALTVWPLIPWLLLRARSLRDRADAGATAGPHPRALYLLIALGLLVAMSLSVPLLEGLLFDLADRNTYEGPFLVGDFTPPVLLLGSGAPAAVAALVMWAYGAHQYAHVRRRKVYLPGRTNLWARVWAAAATAANRRRPLVALLIGAAIVLGGLATTAAVAAQLQEPFDHSAAGFWPVILGVAGGAGGAALVAAGVAEGGRARVVAALLGTAVMATLAVAWATPSWTSDGVADALVFPCQVALLSAVFWVTARGTGSDRAASWLSALWPRVGVVVVAAFMLVRLDRGDPGSRTSLVNEIYPMSYSLRPWVSLALLVVGIGLTWWLSRSDRSVSRNLGVLIALAMLFRPDVQYLGIPWGLLAGWIMVAYVLLPRDQVHPVRFHPRGMENSEELISRLYRASAAARISRDANHSLARKVASADVSSEDALLIGRRLAGALRTTAHRPKAGARRAALSWAGQADAWRRARLGAALAGFIGLVLQVGTLSEGFSGITNLTGLNTWTTVATIVLAFRYPIYGLVFGFLYPLVPGATGFAKGLRLFATLAISETTILVIPLETSIDAVGAVGLRVLQLGLVCTALGVGGDVLALRRAGVGLTGLRDLYHTSALFLWSSSVLVTVVTATATTALGSAATLLVDRIIPEPALVQQEDARQRDQSLDTSDDPNASAPHPGTASPSHPPPALGGSHPVALAAPASLLLSRPRRWPPAPRARAAGHRRSPSGTRTGVPVPPNSPRPRAVRVPSTGFDIDTTGGASCHGQEVLRGDRLRP